MAKTSFVLPGRDGSWEMAPFTVHVESYGRNGLATIKPEGPWLGPDEYVLLRRVKEPPPMPRCRVGDVVWVKHEDFGVPWVPVYVESSTPGEGRGPKGDVITFFACDVVAIWRDGEQIWKRP